MHWFTRGWWAYLFERPSFHAYDYLSDQWCSGWFIRLWCRVRGHPAGVWWDNPGGLEPDMHCKNCGDDLG